jgi:hypothetical protein
LHGKTERLLEYRQNRQGIEAQTEADGRVIDALQMGGVLGRRSDGPVA